MKKLAIYYKDQLVMFVGSNLSAAIGLFTSLVLLKLLGVEEFNLYSSLFAFYLVLTTIPKTSKSLFTVYGKDLWSLFLKFKYQFIGLLLALIVGASVASFYIYGAILWGILIVSIIFFQLVFFNFVGVWQNEKKFLEATKLIVAQNIFKLFCIILGVLFFRVVGFWFGILLSLTIFAGFLIQTSEFRLNIDVIKKLSIPTLASNFLLLLSFEAFFSFDSIFLNIRFLENEVFFYNSMGIIKRVIFFATFAIGNILLTDIKKRLTKDVLFKNLSFLMVVVSGVLGGFWVLNDIYFNFAGVQNPDQIMAAKILLFALLSSFYYLLLIATIKQGQVAKIIFSILNFVAVVVVVLTANSIEMFVNLMLLAVAILLAGGIGINFAKLTNSAKSLVYNHPA